MDEVEQAILKKYKPIIDCAKENEWEVDCSKLKQNGPMFKKDEIEIWKIRDSWQCADLLDGHYQNHRPYKQIFEALRSE